MKYNHHNPAFRLISRYNKEYCVNIIYSAMGNLPFVALSGFFLFIFVTVHIVTVILSHFTEVNI